MLTMEVECDAIETYANGKLALDRIKELLASDHNIPEVIFLDINMPIMDGWQFLEEFITLRTEQKIRINIVTSSIDPHDLHNWESFKDKSRHLITYNYKPIKRADIAAMSVSG